MQNQEPLIPASQISTTTKTKSSMWQMWLIIIIFAAPVIASYLTFYVIKPTGGKTNYGQLVSPVQPAPEDSLMPIVYGKWTLLIARPAEACSKEEEHCVKLLFLMRQVRASLGREMERVQIVWINTDNSKVSENLQEAYNDQVGVKIVGMPTNEENKDKLTQWLNMDDAKDAIHLLDPKGDRMMRFSVNPQPPEFPKMRKDIEKLLKWNPTGKYGK
ncbi:hypothetical protein PSHI8_22300 [Polynucleobacter sp. SHI8]|uniref:hypothetical protein n=1 Tax=unclassified Polynucleobacter TaxID=2640945 RepID=UPI00248FD4AE|nr:MULTISPECIES: hypothetical protein [unclassified Polynucleobacter]BDW12146.1 hypothetical protein PSHI2_22280 [Polynucleobacter sp. SHI2]BDW14594.1 hypothetical protein PSHI8_22300 [Polynucleobacter sp. SHI8]